MTPVLYVLLLAVPAQSPGWDAVRALPDGTRIKIETRTEWPAEVDVISSTADALMVRDGHAVRTIRKMDINTIDRLVSGSNRGGNIRKGFLWGLAIGAVRAALCDGCNRTGIALVTMPSVAIGTAVGAARSATKWEQIYRKKRAR